MSKIYPVADYSLRVVLNNYVELNLAGSPFSPVIVERTEKNLVVRLDRAHAPSELLNARDCRLWLEGPEQYECVVTGCSENERHIFLYCRKVENPISFTLP